MRTVNVIEGIFFAALEKPAATERSAYLDQACAGDLELRRCVERMLAAQQNLGNFLQPGDTPRMAEQPALEERPGTVIGPYKLLQILGEGGFGVVFMAEQEQPVRRKVALKIIKPGMDSKQVVARFEAERQALALMDHPNIAKVFDGGTTESGRPYFVMELVKGVPITEFCDQNRLPPHQRLELFISVCQAVQHAHQKGVIHRDLKPSNVLVTLYDDKPVPKVIDFGVAKAIEQKLTEHTLFTNVGQVIGTLEYMSPEQASLNALDVDTRSDVYALGVLLYVLLTGTTPLNKERLQGVAFLEMLRLIREEEPPKPSTRLSESAGGLSMAAAYRKTEPQKLPKLVRGELDWITMRALEKDRARRYDTAIGLAKDVERYLNGDAVEACTPTLRYRLLKMYRRNRGQVIAASLVLFALVVGMIGTSLGLVAANRAAVAARDEEQRAIVARVEKEDALAAETIAKDRLQSSLAAEMQATYDMTIAQAQRAMEECDQPRAAELLALCPVELRDWEWHYLNRQFDRNATVIRPSFGPGRTNATAIYPTPDGRELLCLSTHPLGLFAQRWDTSTGKKTSEKQITFPPGTQFRFWCAVSPDRRLIAVWEPPSNFFKTRGGQVNPKAPEKVPVSARSVRVYNLQTGDQVGELRGHTNWIYHVIFSNDSKQIVTGSSDRTIRFWDTTGKPGMVLNGHTKAVAIPLAFTPDGRTLLTAGRDFKAVARDENGLQRNFPTEQATPERDEWFAWDLDTQKPRTKSELAGLPLENFRGFDPNLSISADGRYAILPDWVVSAVVDLETGRRAAPLGWHTEPIGFTPGGKSALLLSGAGVISVFDLATGKTDRTSRLSMPTADVLENLVMGNGTHAWDWNLSRDGRVLAIGRDGERKTVIVDTVTGREVGFVADKRSAFIPSNNPFLGGRDRDRVIADDGSFFTSSDNYGEIKLWKLGPIRRVFDFSRVAAEPDGRFGATLPGSVVSPDGRRVAKLKLYREDSKKSLDAQVQFEIHDRATGKVVVAGTRYDARTINHLRFDREGRRIVGLVAKSLPWNIKQNLESRGEYTPTIWDAETGKELLKGKPFVAPVGVGSPNSPQLTVSEAGGVLLASFVPDVLEVSAHQQKGYWQIEELGSGRPPFAFPRESGRVFRFGPGARLGAFFENGPGGKAIEIWDLERHAIVWKIHSQDNPHQSTHGVFSPDGNRLFTFDGGNLGHADTSETRRSVSVTVWDIPGQMKIRSFNPPAEALTTWPRPIDQTGARVLCGDTIWNATTGRALVHVSDGKLAIGPRSQFRPRLSPDFLDELFSETAERSGGVWKPTRPIGSVIAELRAWLLNKSDTSDPVMAVELARLAAQAYPEDMLTISVYGEALLRTGRPGEAIPLLEQSLRMNDGRPDKIVNMGGHVTCFRLAMAYHEVGREQDAKARFANGVARHIKLIATREAYPEQFRSSPGSRPLERSHEVMIEAAHKLGVEVPSLDIGSITRESHVDLRDSLAIRASWQVRTGKTAEGIALAVESVATEPLSVELAYNAACAFALAIPKTEGDPATQARHSDRAVELLKQAIALGWDDVEHMRADTDLIPLRGRDDFKKLVAELERKTESREAAPAGRPDL